MRSDQVGLFNFTPPPNTAFEKGKTDGKTTYVCFTQFYGDRVDDEHYPQQYSVSIHPDFKKYFEN